MALIYASVDPLVAQAVDGTCFVFAYRGEGRDGEKTAVAAGRWLRTDKDTLAWIAADDLPVPAALKRHETSLRETLCPQRARRC